MGTYSQLSDFMVEYPETYIVRTFSKLNAKNVLYYQAELVHLEQELEEIEEEDATTPSRQSYCKRWKKLQAGIEEVDLDPGPQQDSRRDQLQWQTFKKIRTVLEKYSK